MGNIERVLSFVAVFVLSSLNQKKREVFYEGKEIS